MQTAPIKDGLKAFVAITIRNKRQTIKIGQRQGPNSPIMQELIAEPHPACDSFRITELWTVVYAPHIFHQNIDLQSLRRDFQRYPLRIPTFNRTDIGSVGENKRTIAYFLQDKLPSAAWSRDLR
ncbi:hypothetical protein D3C73_1324280 [compost metagenome]